MNDAMRLDARHGQFDYPYPNRLRVGHVKKETASNCRAVDRRTKWGNPHRIDKKNDRFDVICGFFDHIWSNHKLIKECRTLTAFDAITCHCAPKPCHGDVLAAFADIETGLNDFILHYNAHLAYARNSDLRWSCHIGVIHTRGRDLYSVVRLALDLAIERWGDK